MNSWTMYNFAAVRDFEANDQKNQRVYQFSLQPGAPWDEIEGVLEEFKTEMKRLKEIAEANDAAKKEAQILNAEIVS